MDGRTIAETVTNQSGRYEFDELRPGEYRIVQEQPATVFDGAHRAGSLGGDASVANAISSIRVGARQMATHYDFCEIPASSVSGFVFVDGEPIELEQDETLPFDLSEIRDGVRTTDDTPIQGVTLELRDGINGRELLGEIALPGAYAPDDPIRAITDEDGFYEFPSLPKGNYSVYEVQPDGFIDAIDTPGTTDGIAVNPRLLEGDEIIIEAAISRLVEPPRNDAIILIRVPLGVHSQFNNFSEVLTNFTPDSIPPAPPTSVPQTPFVPEPIAPALRTVRNELPPAPLHFNPIRPDGSSSAKSNTWHLSVIDGGQPRVAFENHGSNILFPASMWRQTRLTHGRWEWKNSEGNVQTHYFGVENSIPVSGDFNGDGSTEIGVFADGHWYLDLDGNGRWDSQDLWAKLGHKDDIPVVGDWDGDGKDDIGIFGRAWPGDPRALRTESGLPDMENVPDGTAKNIPPNDGDATLGRRVMKLTATGRVRTDVIDHVFLYGQPG